MLVSFITAMVLITPGQVDTDSITKQSIVATAEQYFGTPYCHGGTTPRCFDCSGFTQYIYNKNGIIIPRVADAQLDSMTRISQEEANPGDLVFFMSGGYAYHVGIYYGDGVVLHSPKPGRSVKLEKIWTSNVVFATIE